MQLQLLVLRLHQKYTYRSRSRFTVVVDICLSDDDWPKMSREAENLQLIIDYDYPSYVHFYSVFDTIPSLYRLYKA